MFSEDECDVFLKESQYATQDELNDSPVVKKRFRLFRAVQPWVESRKRSIPVFTHLLVFLITSVIWGGSLLFFTLPSPHSHKSVGRVGHSLDDAPFFSGAKYSHCGRSAPEARALGCQYDILSNHWVPGKCMDQSAVEEYQSDESWYGYADENRTEVLSIDAMSETSFYYTNERDHIVHCAMLWRKQYRAFAEGRTTYDSIIADSAHTNHCSEYLINMTTWGIDFRTMPIKVFVGYAGCYDRGEITD